LYISKDKASLKMSTTNLKKTQRIVKIAEKILSRSHALRGNANSPRCGASFSFPRAGVGTRKSGRKPAKNGTPARPESVPTLARGNQKNLKICCFGNEVRFPETQVTQGFREIRFAPFPKQLSNWRRYCYLSPIFLQQEMFPIYKFVVLKKFVVLNLILAKTR